MSLAAVKIRMSKGQLLQVVAGPATGAIGRACYIRKGTILLDTLNGYSHCGWVPMAQLAPYTTKRSK